MIKPKAEWFNFKEAYPELKTQEDINKYYKDIWLRMPTDKDFEHIEEQKAKHNIV